MRYPSVKRFKFSYNLKDYEIEITYLNKFEQPFIKISPGDDNNYWLFYLNQKPINMDTSFYDKAVSCVKRLKENIIFS